MTTIQLPNAEFLPHVCELVAQGHKVTIRAKGNSMRPFLESGRDNAVLSKIDTPKVGDVVLAEIHKGKYVLHRIDCIDGQNIILRGDGNVHGTEECTNQDLRAIATEITRNGKTWHTDSRSWRICSYTWRLLLPFRRILLALYRLLCFRQLPDRFKKTLK